MSGQAGAASPGTPGEAPGDGNGGQLHLRRWTMTTGSGTERSAGSRAAVVLAAGDSQWEGTAESAGAIGALLGALDAALEGVLGGRVRLVSFDVRAMGETAAADALVELVIEPPAGASGERATGRYPGAARHVNLVAACADAYLAALRALLADDAWAGAMAAAGALGGPGGARRGCRARLRRLVQPLTAPIDALLRVSGRWARCSSGPPMKSAQGLARVARLLS
jgi:LeuA allosteric (dimerisation) domain